MVSCLLKAFLTPSCVYCRYTQPKQLDAACKWRHKSGPCSTAICYGRYKSSFWWTWQQTSTNRVTEQQLLYVWCQTFGSCSVLWRSCNDQSISKVCQRRAVETVWILHYQAGMENNRIHKVATKIGGFLFELLKFPFYQLLWSSDMWGNSRLCFIVNNIIPALFVLKKNLTAL